MSSPDLEQLIAKLRDLRPEFERTGVVHLALFGSRARQDHRPTSDIDLFIDVLNSDQFSLLDLVGVGHIVEDALDLPTSVVMRRSISPRFAAATQSDAIEIF